MMVTLMARGDLTTRAPCPVSHYVASSQIGDIKVGRQVPQIFAEAREYTLLKTGAIGLKLFTFSDAGRLHALRISGVG